MQPRRGERGQLGVFLLGLLAVVVSLIVVAVDVTAVLLARGKLYDLADAAALHAADSVAEEQLYRSGLGEAVPVGDQEASAAATAYLQARDLPAQVHSWQVNATAPDGLSAMVVLRAEVSLPWGSALVEQIRGPVVVTVTSRASARVQRGATDRAR